MVASGNKMKTQGRTYCRLIALANSGWLVPMIE